MNRVLCLLPVVFLLISCDEDRHKKCEWYLIPEPDHREMVKKGWVSLCARNYTNNKQRCFLQAKLGYAEKVYGTAFRFTDLKLDKEVFPRKVVSIKACTPVKK